MPATKQNKVLDAVNRAKQAATASPEYFAAIDDLQALLEPKEKA